MNGKQIDYTIQVSQDSRWSKLTTVKSRYKSLPIIPTSTSRTNPTLNKCKYLFSHKLKSPF